MCAKNNVTTTKRHTTKSKNNLSRPFIPILLSLDSLLALLQISRLFPMFLVNPDEMLQHGLSIVGRQSNRNKEFKASAKNRKRFKKFYGSTEEVVAVIWGELQTTNVPEAKVSDAKEKDLSMFLLACHHAKGYAVLETLAKAFGVCEDTASHWARYYLKKLAVLKEHKIVWPTDFQGRKFILLVDCVNFGINEPRHPVLHKVREFFDRKGGKAGLTYEIALDLWSSNIIWLHGPFPSATGDQRIFKEEGLCDEMPEGTKAIADKVYKGQNKISLHNSLDDEEVREFKRRARARQESVNARLKSFECLKQRFRHGVKNHHIYVHAVAVMLTFQMENGSPLFHI